MNANGYYRSVSDSDDTDYDGATLYMRMPDMLIRRHIMPRHQSIPLVFEWTDLRENSPSPFFPPPPSFHS